MSNNRGDLPPNISMLPDEMIYEICQNASIKSLVALAETNSRLNRVVNHYIRSASALSALINNSSRAQIAALLRILHNPPESILSYETIFTTFCSLEKLGMSKFASALADNPKIYHLLENEVQDDNNKNNHELFCCYALIANDISKLNSARLTQAVEKLTKPEHEHIKKSLETIKMVTGLPNMKITADDQLPTDCFLNLSGVEIDTIKHDLKASKLQRATISMSELSDLTLDDANLKHSELRHGHTDLNDASLKRADLRGVDLSRRQLLRTNLENADLRDVDFTASILGKINLSKTDLRNSKLKDAEINEADLSGANLQGLDLSNLNSFRANFTNANLQGVNFQGARLEKANFEGANLEGTKFMGARFFGEDCFIWIGNQDWLLLEELNDLYNSLKDNHQFNELRIAIAEDFARCLKKLPDEKRKELKHALDVYSIHDLFQPREGLVDVQYLFQDIKHRIHGEQVKDGMQVPTVAPRIDEPMHSIDGTRVDEKTELSTPADLTSTTPLDAPLSEKAKALVVKAKVIAPNTPDAYEFIRQCFLSYSKANMGNLFLARAVRFLSSQVHYGEPIAKLLLKPDYADAVFDETKLRGFLAELKSNIDQNQINREGDLFAILTVTKRLTGIDFYAIEIKEKLDKSVLPAGKQ